MTFSSWYSNLRFKSKIFFVSMVLFLALSVALFTVFIVSSSAEYQTEGHQIALEHSAMVARAFNQEWNNVADKLIKIIVAEEFNQDMALILSEDAPPHRMVADLQTGLNSIRYSSELVRTCYMLDKYGNFYVPYDNYRNRDNLLTNFGAMKNIAQLDILPSTISPFMSNEQVIPIIIPLNRFGTRKLEVSHDKEPELLIMVLLDAEKVKKQIAISSTTFFDSTSNLYFRGKPLFQGIEHDREDCFTIEKDTDLKGLAIRFYIEEKSYPSIGTVFITYLIIGMTIAFMIAVLAIMRISKKMTEPLEDMTSAVYSIADRTYDYSLKAKYNDETSTLIKGINEMYATLEEQFNHIKNEEALKYLYKSQMLTLEVHPHFIYNTLEMINMEVMSGNDDVASDMIQTFASFLRYTLNQRSDWTTLSREYEYIRSYLRLMNKRMNGHISFDFDCEEGLEEFKLPKSTLLPLVENCIKHGFPPEEMNSIYMPQITIRSYRVHDNVHIVVTDNGVGIDCEKAERIIHDPEIQKGHIGIGNVYGRIKLYYKKAEMLFRSIPYFQNEVEIILTGTMQDLPEETEIL